MRKVSILFLIVIINLFASQNAFCSANESSFGYGGFTFGTPGLINITIGNYWERIGFHGSISALNMVYLLLTEENEDTYEDEVEDEDTLTFALLQANFNIKIYEKNRFLFAFSIGGGTYFLDDENNPENDFSIFYIGPCIHIMYHGFFTELGFAYSKDFEVKEENRNTNVLPMIQIGYFKRI